MLNTEIIEKYKLICKEKKDYHYLNANRAEKWNDLLNNLLNVSGGITIITTGLSVFTGNPIVIAIVGVTLSGVTFSLSNFKNYYKLNSLMHQHESLGDTFAELEFDMDSSIQLELIISKINNSLEKSKKVRKIKPFKFLSCYR